VCVCGFVECECAHCAYASRMAEGGVCVFVVHFIEQRVVCNVLCVFICACASGCQCVNVVCGGCVLVWRVHMSIYVGMCLCVLVASLETCKQLEGWGGLQISLQLKGSLPACP
jgi:hypothetical protein